MERDWAVLGWKMLVTRGVLAIVFGIIAMFWPVGTALTLALLWGIWALIDGVGSLWQAFRPESKGQGRAWLVIMGVIAIIAGFIAIFHPGVAVAALTWILGIWLIVRGVIELVGAFTATIACRAGCSSSAACSRSCSVCSSSPTPRPLRWPSRSGSVSSP